MTQEQGSCVIGVGGGAGAIKVRRIAAGLASLALATTAAPICAQKLVDDPWTEFVSVAGQPEPVPAQWVSTPEGKFAHSIVIPNPVPKDSGYRWWMSGKKYFEHLCKTEAGEFIFKTVKDVEGFYFARPPRRPTDDDLMARYRLEAPEIERTFQLMRASAERRAKMFVNPPWNLYRYIEEPAPVRIGQSPLFLRSSGYVQGSSPMEVRQVSELTSEFALVWRGVRREHDRKSAIAGSEWIVLNLKSKEVLAVQRNYGLSGFSRGVIDGIWWLNATRCPNLRSANIFSQRFYEFASKVMQLIGPRDR